LKVYLFDKPTAQTVVSRDWNWHLN